MDALYGPRRPRGSRSVLLRALAAPDTRPLDRPLPTPEGAGWLYRDLITTVPHQSNTVAGRPSPRSSRSTYSAGSSTGIPTPPEDSGTTLPAMLNLGIARSNRELAPFE